MIFSEEFSGIVQKEKLIIQLQFNIFSYSPTARTHKRRYSLVYAIPKETEIYYKLRTLRIIGIRSMLILRNVINHSDTCK